MPLYRVKGNDNIDGRPREMIIDAPDPESAKQAARAAQIWSPRIEPVGPSEYIPPSEIVRSDAPPPPGSSGPRTDHLRERPILTIALGVFLGMTMFFLCITFVSCAVGGRVYIG